MGFGGACQSSREPVHNSHYAFYQSQCPKLRSKLKRSNSVLIMHDAKHANISLPTFSSNDCKAFKRLIPNTSQTYP